ncbi:hypothetical protein AG1IA_01242 [Rhizoctonia solani AG-1 IA]|nr:hypothetical protein AG1IA_01242 [Rhizoctonia solani AG-1 IA]
MVSCLPPDEECNASSSDAPVEDEDVIVCDSYFSYVYAPSDPTADPTPTPASFSPEHSEDLADSLSDLPFHSTPSLVHSMDVDSDEEGPSTPSTSFVDTDTPHNNKDCHDPYDEPLIPLFDEPVSRSSIIRTCVPYNPPFISPTYY